jgi:hypothetical protein
MPSISAKGLRADIRERPGKVAEVPGADLALMSRVHQEDVQEAE